ncbi:hypothetical protein LTR53_015285 [Teratosphaeriaceae sp. CCFEE 6253]|nr:hypothetical protein LTR53_015285 [Teratosphaeriaceae sp. CCFEE 6253]
MAALTLIRPTTGRAVHFRVMPRPSNIGESREILRLISQFGEVEYFKSLKYEALPAANTAIVIFREEDAARQCLKRSPCRREARRATLPNVGLSDINWRGVEKPWAVVDREKEADAAYKGSGRRKSLHTIYDESG